MLKTGSKILCNFLGPAYDVFPSSHRLFSAPLSVPLKGVDEVEEVWSEHSAVVAPRANYASMRDDPGRRFDRTLARTLKADPSLLEIPAIRKRMAKLEGQRRPAVYVEHIINEQEIREARRKERRQQLEEEKRKEKEERKRIKEEKKREKAERKKAKEERSKEKELRRAIEKKKEREERRAAREKLKEREARKGEGENDSNVDGEKAQIDPVNERNYRSNGKSDEAQNREKECSKANKPDAPAGATQTTEVSREV